MVAIAKDMKDKIFEQELIPQIDALYNFAFHLTYNEADANDLVQDTYLKAYRFIASYESGTNAKAWLFRILKNSFINEYRKKSKQPTRIDYEDLQQFHNEEEDTNLASFVDLREEIFDNIMGDEVTLAMNALPQDFRTVILLCDIDGLKYDEIAEVLEIPVGTVRSRLFRARNMLKEKLRDYAAEMGFKDKRK